jgi:predicted helicase
MNPEDIEKLRRLTSFPALVDYLRDELDWPIEVEDADDITFEYDPEELGIDAKHAVKIESIKQVRPLVDRQPWGVFFIDFEAKRLPVVVLRRILRSLVPKSRGSDPDRPVWRMSDLMFISAQGEAGYRSISFAHFHQRQDRLPELRTFSWDSQESHFFYLQNLNLEALRWPAPEVEANATAWREQWGQAFTVEHRYVIQTSQMLAREMARQARTVRELVEEIYDLEAAGGPLHRLYDSFKEVLLHDLTPEAFADMVAQTVAYGLFSAATQSDELTTLEHMVEMIPKTNPFLKELLSELTTEGAVDLEELGVGQLVELLWQTDFEAILQDFGRQSGEGREDPVVHFYELFLAEYDKEQKVRRGVFYTPDPVVSYIVRSVDYLLKSEFGLEDGLADTSTNPETGEPLVQILDPAAGTGTFLAHVIDQIEATVKAKGGVDWSAYVAEHLLPRLNGFELMMAPYAVAHMKLGLKLRQTGYDFRTGERLRVYLTNTLQEPVERHERLALAGFLSREADVAGRVKQRVPITVIVGNPPYSNYGRMNRMDWILDLLSEYKRDLHEKKLNLDDDFIKFVRFGQWRINQTGAGILALITNNVYVDSVTHRRMRESLMKTFTDIYILDLHGSIKRKEKCPDGSKDENVFDIQPGVAVGVFVKNPEKTGVARIHHHDLWGLREDKYARLHATSAEDTDWLVLQPKPTHFFFVPKNFELESEYLEGVELARAFPVCQNGLKTDRDDLFYGLDRATVEDRIRSFYSESGMHPEFRERYRVRDSSSYDLLSRRLRTSFDAGSIHQCHYRPLDRRWVYYAPGLTSRPAWDVMRHMLGRGNVALITGRSSQVIGSAEWDIVSCTNGLVDTNLYRRGGNIVFPLYLFPDAADRLDQPRGLFDISSWPEDKSGSMPNLAPWFVADIEKRLGLCFVSHEGGDLAHSFGPEDILHYAYAVFHSHNYRDRYAEFLKTDYPRLPLTSNRELFARLVGLGADLVAAHLLADDYRAASWNQAGGQSPLQQPITTFVARATGTTMGAFSKRTCYKEGRVYLDTSQRSRSSYFEGVPEDVWNFHIGGYQVCHKWLYDRRGKRGQPGRTLTEDDIAHYQRIVVALKETIRLMEEIDEVIEAHGGWPIR